MSAHQQWTREVERQLGDSYRRDGHTRVYCPACLTRAGKVDREKSASVNNSNGWVRCHRCQWRTRVKGDWLRFDVVELSDEEFEDCGVEQPSDYNLVTDEVVRLVAPHAIKYLFDRRIRPDIVKAMRVGYALEGDHAGRLIFPAVDAPDWRQVGWVGRVASTTSKRRRYHQASGMDTRSTFFNDDRLGDPSSEYNVVVEGALDSLRHWPLPLAAWGKVKEPHLRRLVQSGKPTVFVGDGDAWCEYLAAARTMQCYNVPAWCLRLPAGVDPGVIPRKAFKAAVEAVLINRCHTELS